MKKVFTLAFASLFALAALAADHYPSVIIKSRRNFEVVVDGRNYFDDHSIRLDRPYRGMHTIKVYERSRWFFGTRLRLVSSKRFFVGNEDLRITVNAFGNIDIDEMGYGRSRGRNYDRDRDWNDRGYDRDWDDDDDIGRHRDHGRGNGRGHRF
jgi:hypothetical protein